MDGAFLAKDEATLGALNSPDWNTVNCSWVYGFVSGVCTNLTASQWSPPYVSLADMAAAGSIKTCSAWGAPEISYSVDELVPGATYAVDATVSGLNYYEDVYTDAGCSESSGVSVVVECTGGTAVFLTAESTADHTMTASLGDCVADLDGKIVVTVNHRFQFYNQTLGVGDFRYVPYGNPVRLEALLAGQPSTYCNYATGTLNTLTSLVGSPVASSDPCTFFTPATQGGMWVSSITATVAEAGTGCSGAATSTAETRKETNGVCGHTATFGG
jgi:hypothetical protein